MNRPDPSNGHGTGGPEPLAARTRPVGRPCSQQASENNVPHERRLNTQTWTIVGTLIALGVLLVATNLWG